MNGQVHMGGGFGSSTDNLSPTLQARIAAADAEYERQSAVEEYEAQLRREIAAEANVHLSIVQAQERGELVDVRKAIRDGGVGHTRQDFLALCAARQDVEDMRAAARQQAAFRKWQAEQDTSADTSAPTAVELAEGEVIAGRAANYRRKHRERSEAIVAARTLARMDREAGR